ncbi:MAG: ribosome maturation factor RimP [Wenzhouxiangellaceae bacterium]
MSIRDELSELIRPVVEALGYEFVGLEYLSNPKNRLVRIYIDRDPDGINVDDCADVSREVSALLDVEDPVSGHYSLEVSSPGIERPLFEPAHYQRFVGETVALQLNAPVDNQARFTGRLVDADDRHARLEVDGGMLEVAYEEIRRAHIKPDLATLMAGHGKTVPNE